MKRLSSLPGEHFKMGDGSYLVVPAKAGDAEPLEQSKTDGDVVFFLSRRPGKLIALLRPAGEKQIDEETIRNTASVIAFQLRKKRLVFDVKREHLYQLLFRVLPCSFDIATSVKPATKRYIQKRSLRPSAKRGVAEILIEEINSDIKNGYIQRAMEKAHEVHGMQPEYKEMIAKRVLEEFLKLGKGVTQDEGFYLPHLLAAHKSFRAVLNELEPYVQTDALPAPKGRAILASIRGDYGQGKDIVADVLMATGHKVADLGSNRQPSDILTEVRKGDAGLLVLTALVPISLRLAADVSKQGKSCRKAVKKLMALLDQQGLRRDLEVILVGFAFDKRFARQTGAETVCRTLWSLFLSFQQRTSENQKG